MNPQMRLKDLTVAPFVAFIFYFEPLLHLILTLNIKYGLILVNVRGVSVCLFVKQTIGKSLSCDEVSYLHCY